MMESDKYAGVGNEAVQAKTGKTWDGVVCRARCG